MDEAGRKWTAKVYRLRGLPARLTTEQVARLLSTGLDLPEHNIVVASLARTVGWEGSRTKIATVQFKLVPAFFRSRLDHEEWDLSTQDGLDGVILDCHFLGLTPLNDVKQSIHNTE